MIFLLLQLQLQIGYDGNNLTTLRSYLDVQKEYFKVKFDVHVNSTFSNIFDNENRVFF